MSASTATGTCLCGAVTLAFRIQDHVFDACHCGMCRKWSGGPALTVQADGEVTFTGEDHIGTYSSSEWAERGFCKRCGTHLFYRLKAGGFINMPLGLLENPEQFKFHMQIFVDRKPSNYAFANVTEQMTEAEIFAKYAPP
jgi:hypothetical protein